MSKPSLNLNETSSPAPGKYCPKCYLSGSALGTCGNFALGCPEPEDILPDTIVEISCGPCGKQMAIPVSAIMKHKTKELGLCTLDKCAATLLPPLVTVTPGPVALGDPEPAPAKKVRSNQKP